MERSRVSMSAITGNFETDALDADVSVESVFMVIKGSAGDEIVWAGRSGGKVFSSEELLGALEALTESIRRRLADDWAW